MYAIGVVVCVLGLGATVWISVLSHAAVLSLCRHTPLPPHVQPTHAHTHTPTHTREEGALVHRGERHDKEHEQIAVRTHNKGTAVAPHAWSREGGRPC